MVARTWIQDAGARFAKGDMTGRAISYDPACYRLAEHFLDEHRDHPKFKEWCDELAQNIQWHIELYAHDWPVTGNAY
jgi:tRNA-dihydrouridine synthase